MSDYQNYFSVTDRLRLAQYPEAIPSFPTSVPNLPNMAASQYPQQPHAQQPQQVLQHQIQQQKFQIAQQQAAVAQQVMAHRAAALTTNATATSQQAMKVPSPCVGPNPNLAYGQPSPMLQPSQAMSSSRAQTAPLSPTTPLHFMTPPSPSPQPLPQAQPMAPAMSSGLGNLDLATLDAETLLTLKETLTALERLGSPNFLTPEMIVQVAQQNNTSTVAGNILQSPRTPFQIEQSSPISLQESAHRIPGLLPYLAMQSQYVGNNNKGYVMVPGGQGMIPKLDLSRLAINFPQIALADLSDDSPVKFRSKREKKLYKTELCLLWSEKGQCEFGDSCKYAHGDEELKEVRRHPRFKTEVCRHYTETGTCPFGRRCHFLHPVNGDLSATTTISTSDNLSNSGSLSPKRLPVFESLASSDSDQES
eukprot:TRINITY_DN570_c0_g1_i1.p1 TRINITY_DN570_c0_g1~~TRINITY_DN570_c0_g1_i1.p1  ORF type:complete len:420 (-),score=41.04 TRINITY_DN570_c0_g1_i1:4293-5552(-)